MAIARPPTTSLSPEPFCVLRTPLLPFDEFLRWTTDCTAAKIHHDRADSRATAAAWHDDVAMLRARLTRIIQRAEVRHALAIASPSLDSAVAQWLEAPDSAKSLKAERALVKYFMRMTGRCTPFGLFAGWSLATVDEAAGARNDLRLWARERYCSNTRLDYGYLSELTEALRHDPASAVGLRYAPNTSLHRLGQAWHFVAARRSPKDAASSTASWSHRLVRVQSDPFLDAVLEAARPGATFEELQGVLTRIAEGADRVEPDEAAAYLEELIDSGVLVSRLDPLLTGESALADLILQLEGTSAADTLSVVGRCMEALDARIIGAPQTLDDYQRVADWLGTLPARVDPSTLFQVDLVKPLEMGVLRSDLFHEVIDAVSLLSRSAASAEPREIQTFRERFRQRYETAWVPLLEALDQDAGVGFGEPSPDASPLLRDLNLRAKERLRSEGGQITTFQQHLLSKVASASRAGMDEIVLDDTDFPAADGDPLPAAFAVVMTVAAKSREALQQGDVRFVLHTAVGPSGGLLLGRFCDGDPRLSAAVRQHLRHEEASEPEAIFAEVVHLPQGRAGNVLCRPILREYEIPYLGRSGAEMHRQIAGSDLLVSVAHDDRILLFSKTLQRRVIPRLTSAHTFQNPSLLPVYRFLCYLQGQYAMPALRWGPLSTLDDLPRVRLGRVVLFPRTWRLAEQEVRDLSAHSGVRAFEALQAWRRRRAAPRMFVVVQGDERLTVDCDNALSVNAFVHLLKRVKRGTVEEMLPAPDELWVTGPEGRYLHELVVPIRHRPLPDVEALVRTTFADAPVEVPPAMRRFSPGGDWLYFKMYASEAALDELLTTWLPGVVKRAEIASMISDWFFLRFADPETHLRVRLRGVAERLAAKVLPLIAREADDLVRSGTIWRFEFATYDREIERHGGPEGVDAAERIFHADSEAVLDLLPLFKGDGQNELRWRAALLGIHRLLLDCGLSNDERRTCLARLREPLRRPLHSWDDVRKQLALRFRAERQDLGAMCAATTFSDPLMQSVAKTLDRRSARIVPIAHALRRSISAGNVRRRVSDVAETYVHMHVNRMMRSLPSDAYELVLYDLLLQLYGTREMRVVD